MVNINLAFIDSMQFMNPSLEGLVKNLFDHDCKHLLREISGDVLRSKTMGTYHTDNSRETFHY